MAAYRFGLPAVLTKGRVIGSAALIVLVLVQFTALSPEDLEGSGVSTTTLFLALVIGILVPVFTVSMASNVVGAAVADGTLVYPWLRPAPRWQLALGHIGAALTLNLPVALIASAGAAIVVSSSTFGLDSAEGRNFLAGALAAGAAAALAYTPLIVALGARFKRASTFAFVYIFLWEQLFARNSTGISRISLQTYVRSAFYGFSGADPSAEFQQAGQLGEVVSPGVAWLVIAGVVVAGIALTGLVLKQADVE
jgi:ABC-type transport system involved in multi-copper enzyme maturation permease subunit